MLIRKYENNSLNNKSSSNFSIR